jgi:hypothetical protein
MADTEIKEEKASESRFDYLHNLLTEKLIKKLESGDVTHQEMMAAINWLKANGVDSPGTAGSPIDRLSNLLPDIDPSFIQEQINHGAKALV